MIACSWHERLVLGKPCAFSFGRVPLCAKIRDPRSDCAQID